MDVAAIIDEIESGSLDGQLAGIVEAVKERTKVATVEFCWRLEFAGMTIDEENLTLAELERIERLTAKPWWQLAPQRNVTDLAAVLTTCMMERLSYDAARAGDALKQHTWRKVLASFTEYEVNSPKAGTAPD